MLYIIRSNGLLNNAGDTRIYTQKRWEDFTRRKGGTRSTGGHVNAKKGFSFDVPDMHRL